MPEYTRKPNEKCIVCEKPIYKRKVEIIKNKGRIFCSRTCYGFACRKESPCIVCGEPILANAHKKTCSRACANKHRTGIAYKLNQLHDKVKNYKSLKLKLLSQRGKKCERCGYDKYEILQVHHLDRNNQNNELTNLELICPNCHFEGHYLEKSWLKKNQ